MDPQIIQQLVLGVVPPGLMASVVFAAIWFRSKAPGDPVQPAGLGELARRLAPPIALAVILIGCFQFVIARSFPPRDSTSWLAIATGVFGITGLLLNASKRGWVRATALIGAAVFAGWVSARPIWSSWSMTERATQVGVFAAAAAIAALAAAGAGTHGQRRGPGPIFVLMAWVGAVSQLLVLGYFSLKLSQVVGIMAAGLGGAWLVALWRRQGDLGPGGIAVASLIAITGLYHGALYANADRPYLLAGLAAASPVVWFMAARFLPKRLGPIARTLMEAALIVLPTAGAIAYAVLTKQPSEY